MGKTKQLLICILAMMMLSFSPVCLTGGHTVSASSATTRTARKSGWVKRNGRIYYFRGGKKLLGLQKINGHYYFFTRKKSIRGALRTGLVKLNGVEYHFKKSGKAGVIGRASSGWTYVTGRGYCFCIDGKIQKNQWIQDYYASSNGSLQNSSKILYKYVRKTVKSLTNSSMSQLDKLRACYNYLCSDTFTYVTKRPFSYGSDWRLVYGLEMFRTHSGVCYNFAAALAYMARYIGYDEVKAVAGELLYLDGHWDLHSWTRIRIDGTWYLFDSSMEHGGMGDFWMKPLSSTSAYTASNRKYREWSNYLN